MTITQNAAAGTANILAELALGVVGKDVVGPIVDPPVQAEVVERPEGCPVVGAKGPTGNRIK